MKKQFFKRLFSVLLWVFAATLSFGKEGAVNNPDAEFACQAPPPGYFIVTVVTPTSISLTWGPSTPFTYYQLEGYDNTNLTPLPTVYPGIGVSTYTYSGLTPGHNYTFKVRASYCPNGEWSDPLTLSRSTPFVIFEDIVELQGPCTPSTSQRTGSNVEFDICVTQSSSSTLPDNNSFIGQFSYQNNVLKFLVAYVGTNIEVRPMNYNGFPPSSNFDFNYTSGTSVGESVDCLYGQTTLFTLDNVSITGTLFNEANMTITFKETLTGFLFCNSCEGERSSDNDAQAKMTSEETSLRQAPKSMPNPFSAFTTLQYELAEESNVGINLFDAMGRLVQVVEKTTLKPAGSYQSFVDGVGLADGVYFLHLQTDQQHEVITLVKKE